MSRRLLVARRADLDIEEICDYLAARSVRTAERFLDAIQSALASIARFPEAGGRLLLEEHPHLDFRYCRVAGFETYLAFYRLTDMTIEVVRVLHGSRDLASALENA